SNWVQYMSESLAKATGTKSVMSEGVIITPQAWIPVFLTEPSKIWAWLIVFERSSLPFEIRINSLAFSTLSEFFNLAANLERSFAKPNKAFNLMSGTSLASLSASDKGRFNALAVSRMADLA